MTNAVLPAVHEAAQFLRERRSDWPSTAVILGSAQGAFLSALEMSETIPYSEIPGWPVTSVPGHSGQLIAGTIGGHAERLEPGFPVTVLSGRVHLYEGWSPQQVVFGVRVLGALGLKILILASHVVDVPPVQRGALLTRTDRGRVHLVLFGEPFNIAVVHPSDALCIGEFAQFTFVKSVGHDGDAKRLAQSTQLVCKSFIRYVTCH